MRTIINHIPWKAGSPGKNQEPLDITTKVARRDNEDGEDMVFVGFSRSLDGIRLSKREAQRLANSLFDVLSDIADE